MKDKKNDRALWIRGTLLARRKEMKLSLRAATARINEFLPEGEEITHQSLDKWEKLEVQPRVDHINAWCKGLGLRFRILVLDPDLDRVSAEVPAAFVPLVGAMERLDAEDIALVKSLIDRLSRPPFEESSTGG